MIDIDVLFGVVSVTLIILLLLVIIALVIILAGKKSIKQKIELTETKLLFEKELRKAEVEVSEQVMTRFAQELHDNVGQLLTAMHIHLENQKLDQPELADTLKPIEGYLNESTLQLKLLSRTLNNDYLGHIGLVQAIELEVERIKALKRFTVKWSTTLNSIGLDKNHELILFRIFQEIVQNALRHSKAKYLTIILSGSSENWELEIQDDGQGFDVNAIMNSHQSSGLRNIKRRAELAHLACDIVSEKDKGTLFKINNL